MDIKKIRCNKNRLIIDPEAAETVRLIFSLAESGLGNIAIADELKARRIIAPSVYKYQRGDNRYARYSAVESGNHYEWRHGTIGHMLRNRVYLGELTSLKTEVINCKTKQHVPVPRENQIITPEAHEAIITEEQYERVQLIRTGHNCRQRKTLQSFPWKAILRMLWASIGDFQKTASVSGCRYLSVYVSLSASGNLP